MQLEKMNIAHLRAFATIAREGNLTRAAERLHLTQPAVSLQLKTLQLSLNLQLLIRTRGGMKLTPDGAKLLPFADRILDALSEFSQSARSLHSTLSGVLSIGTILDPEFIRLGAFLKRLVENYPLLSTRLQHRMSGDVLHDVRTGALDCGYYLGEPSRDCHFELLTTFSYNVVAPPGWRNRVTGKDWHELACLPWIWSPPESVHNRLLSAAFDRYGVSPNKVALVDQEPSMLDLVKSGVGLSLVRESIAIGEAHAHGLVIADSVAVSTDLSFISLAKRSNEPMLAAVLALLKAVWSR